MKRYVIKLFGIEVLQIEEEYILDRLPDPWDPPDTEQWETDGGPPAPEEETDADREGWVQDPLFGAAADYFIPFWKWL